MKSGFVVIAAAILSGCQSVNSNVSRFHTLEAGSVKTFHISSLSMPSLEASSYADMIGDNLEKLGWHRIRKGVEVGQGSEIEITFAYGIDAGRTVVSSQPVYGQTGGATSYTSGTLYGSGGAANYSGTTYTPATYGVIGSEPVSSIVYSRQLSVTMMNSRNGKTEFEGSVKSSGIGPTFASVAPCLIKAMFKDFPGASGESETVSLPREECKKP